MAPFPIYNPFMISSAVMSSSWAIYSIGAATAALVIIAALGEADPDEEALDGAAAKWRESNTQIKELVGKFMDDAKPPAESWNGTQDRKAFDDIIDKVAAELDSIVKVFEGNATALDEAKNFYNKACPMILAMVVTGTAILVGLMVLKATIVGYAAAEGAQTVTGWAVAAAVLGMIGMIIGFIMAFVAYNESSGKVKFDTEAGKGERGSDVDFQKIEIDWGTSKEGAQPA